VDGLTVVVVVVAGTLVVVVGATEVDGATDVVPVPGALTVTTYTSCIRASVCHDFL